MYFTVEWERVAERKKCHHTDRHSVGKLNSVVECASSCVKRAQMFTFGREGSSQCKGGACVCLCETATVNGGKCKMLKAEHFDLYTYKQGKCQRKFLKSFLHLLKNDAMNFEIIYYI